jgi:hypothetical protein
MRSAKVILMTLIPLFCFGIWDADTHDVNNWIITITNYGRFADISNYWVAESIPFRGAGLWFGIISPQSETLVTIGYGPSGGQSEFRPGLKIQDPNSPLARIYMHPTDWPPDPDTYPMAPQVPLTCQESWSCYNDFDSTLHMPSDGKPIGIEVYQTTFADTFSIIKDVLFLKYEIKNCTTYTIHNAIVSIIWDVDCQEPDAYYNGLILHKWFYPDPEDSFLVEDLGYFYGDTLYYYCDTFAVGVLFIKTPYDQGCTAYKLYTLDLGPGGDNERYLTMAGYNYRTGVYDPYDSLPGAPDDRRTLMSCGPFSISAGEITELVIALIAAPYNNDTLPLATVAGIAKNLYFDSLLTVLEDNQFSSINSKIWSLQVSPNPFRNKIGIKYSIGHRLDGIEMKIYDATGRVVKEFNHLTNNQIFWNGTDDLNRNLPSGVYFLKFKAGDYNATEKLLLIR